MPARGIQQGLICPARSSSSSTIQPCDIVHPLHPSVDVTRHRAVHSRRTYCINWQHRARHRLHDSSKVPAGRPSSDDVNALGPCALQVHRPRIYACIQGTAGPCKKRMTRRSKRRSSIHARMHACPPRRSAILDSHRAPGALLCSYNLKSLASGPRSDRAPRPFSN